MTPEAKTEKRNAPDFYTLPANYTWQMVADGRQQWDIHPAAFPTAVVAGQCCAWAKPIPPIKTELTQAGEQFIIPGTERKLDKPNDQQELW